MEGVHVLSSVFILLLTIGASRGVFQRWLPDTNFENPSNWNAKRAPCGNDVVIIPDESPIVYMQLNTTIKELILPKTGEIILGPTVNLGFTQNADPNCPSANGDVDFTATHPKSWLNPSSWCRAAGEQGACDRASLVLDVEKVPCAFDDAVLSRQHSYFVDLSEQVPELTIKSLKIGGTSFSTSSFSSFLSGEDGSRMFKTSGQPSTSTKVTITRKACNDKRGCPCGNDIPQISKKICTHVEKTCDRPRCMKTIQPVGACCRMCGAVFNITRGYGYDYEAFKNLIKTNFYTAQEQKDINMTVFVTSEGWIQLALNDKTGEKSASLANRIKNDMEEDLSQGGHKYAIDGIQLMLSTGSPIGPSAHSSTKSLGGGSIAGIVIGLIVLLLIFGVLAVCLVFKRTGRDIPLPKISSISMPSVSLPTLPRLPRRMPRATARVPAQPQTAAHIDPGFANPLYDSSPFDDGNAVVKEMELMPSSLDEEQPTFGISAGGGFNNPLYSSHGAAMFDDPAKVSSSSPQAKTKKAKPDDSAASAVATGATKQTADVPTPETSAKMILVDISEETTDSNI